MVGVNELSMCDIFDNWSSDCQSSSGNREKCAVSVQSQNKCSSNTIKVYKIKT